MSWQALERVSTSQLVILFICLVLLLGMTCCKAPQPYRFHLPFSKKTEKILSDEFVAGAEEADPFFDSLTYFDNEQEKEILYSPEFKAKNLHLGMAGTSQDTSIVPIDPQILKTDTTILNRRNSTIPETSRLAQVSFLAGIATILLFLAPLSYPTLTTLLFLTAAAVAMAAGLIAMRRIMKKNQKGRGLAMFGVTIGTLVISILAILLLYAYLIRI